VLLIFVYAGLPFAGLRLSPLSAVAVAFVVLPQAVRNVLADLVSNTVEVVKLASIAGVVALPELLYSADTALGDLQFAADRAGGRDLPRHAVAGGAAHQPAGTAHRCVNGDRMR
jgi:hypothetical protein